MKHPPNDKRLKRAIAFTQNLLWWMTLHCVSVFLVDLANSTITLSTVAWTIIGGACYGLHTLVVQRPEDAEKTFRILLNLKQAPNSEEQPDDKP